MCIGFSQSKRHKTLNMGSISGLGRSYAVGNGPFQYCCLEKKIHGQRSLAGWIPWGHKESNITERLSTHIPIYN